MTTPEYYAQLLEQGVVIGKDEDVIGRVGQVYLDNETGVASWVTVKTGWFGTRESFVPLQAATIRGAEVRVPYDKDTIKGAPHHEFAEQLSRQDEDDLYTYYGIGALGGDARSYPRDATNQPASSSDADAYPTRSEGQLPGGTDNVGTGRPRLRRFLVTEQQTITVPVTHEEIRVVRDPAENGENLGDMRDR
jgi:sporulation protein YlmC with PRC-barrel domain